MQNKVFLKQNFGVFSNMLSIIFGEEEGGTWRHRLGLVLDESYPKLGLQL